MRQRHCFSVQLLGSSSAKSLPKAPGDHLHAGNIELGQGTSMKETCFNLFLYGDDLTMQLRCRSFMSSTARITTRHQF